MKNIIEDYNQWLIEQDYNAMGHGVFYGRMGLCIYWFQQFLLYSNCKYKIVANKLLEEVVSNIGSYSTVGFENGIIGILNTVNDLVEKNCILTNEKSFFRPLEDKIFQYMSSCLFEIGMDRKEDLADLIWACRYFCFRINSGKLSLENEIIMKRLIMASINKVEEKLRNPNLIIEQQKQFLPFSNILSNLVVLIEDMYKLNMFTYKLNMLCREMATLCKLYLPSQGLNHSLLLSNIASLVKTNPKLKKCFSKIFSPTLPICDLSVFSECKGLTLYLRDGLSGLLYNLRRTDVDEKLMLFFSNKIREKVADKKTSWKNPTNFILGNSMTGVFYTYQKLFAYEENRY